MSWQRVRLKHLCEDAGQYGLNVSADQYTTTGVRLLRTSDINDDGTLKPDHAAVHVDPDRALDQRHRLRAGDLLLSRSGTLGRALLVPPHAAGATYAGYLVRFRPRHHTVDPRYLAYLATSTPFQDTVRAEAVTNTIANFNADRYANITVDLPPLHEQHRIADHLDNATAVVDRAARHIEEQLRVLANRVTAFVDETILREPGDAVQLKYLADVVDTEHKTAPHVVGGGYWIAGTSSVRGGRIRREELYETSKASFLEWTRRRRPAPGDVLLSREAPVGEVALYRDDDPEIAIGQRMVLLSPRRGELTSEYLLWSLLSSRAKQFFDQTTQGSMHRHLNLSEIGKVPIQHCLLDRQAQVAERIAAEVARCEQIVKLRRRQLALLAERKRTLTTAAVTR